MSLSERFNQRAKDALNKKIEEGCALTLQALKEDVARAKKMADGKAGVFARHGFNGSGSYASGVFKYTVLTLRSEGSYSFNTWYENGEQMERLLKELLPRHPALKQLHEFCAEHEHNFRIDHDIDKDMSVGMVMPTNYKFTISVTVKMHEPYERSYRPLSYPKPAPKPAAAPVPAPPVKAAPPTPPQPATPAPLTKAQVTAYLSNLRNDRDKREFIELLGGMPKPKVIQRVRLDKPQQ